MKINDIFPRELEKENKILRVVELAKSFYDKNDSAHDFDHALRVTTIGVRIARQEGADIELIVLAGILHDTARYDQRMTGICHAQRGAEIATDILEKLDYSEEKIKKVQEMIRTHRFRGGSKPETLEAKVLFDADKLDAIGAVGIARAYTICGAQNQKIYNDTPDRPEEDSDEYSPLHEYRYKLSEIIDTMLTTTGKELAEDRSRFMARYFEQLTGEIRGKF